VVYRLAYNDDVVAFKMGRHWGSVSAYRRIGVTASGVANADTPTRDSSLAYLPHFA
jgi:hypothetical protein